MTRKNKLIILLSYLVVLTIVMYGYRSSRSKKIKQLHAEQTRAASEQENVRKKEAELAKLVRQLPTEPQTTLFIESLYRLAREAGLTQHEVSSEGTKGAEGSARPGSQATSGAVVKHHLKISASGSYRSFAEYIRLIQNLERSNRITDVKLVPDANRLKGALAIELYSLPAK